MIADRLCKYLKIKGYTNVVKHLPMRDAIKKDNDYVYYTEKMESKIDTHNTTYKVYTNGKEKMVTFTTIKCCSTLITSEQKENISILKLADRIESYLNSISYEKDQIIFLVVFPNDFSGRINVNFGINSL